MEPGGVDLKVMRQVISVSDLPAQWSVRAERRDHRCRCRRDRLPESLTHSSEQRRRHHLICGAAIPERCRSTDFRRQPRVGIASDLQAAPRPHLSFRIHGLIGDSPGPCSILKADPMTVRSDPRSLGSAPWRWLKLAAFSSRLARVSLIFTAIPTRMALKGCSRLAAQTVSEGIRIQSGVLCLVAFHCALSQLVGALPP